MYVWRWAYGTLYVTMLKYRFQLWQIFYRVAGRTKQVRGNWEMMFRQLGIRRKPLSRMWYHVDSWTDAKVSKESAALNSQLHSAAYSKTSFTTVYPSPSRRHTQEDVNFEGKLCKKKKKLSPSEEVRFYRKNGTECHIFKLRTWLLVTSCSVLLLCPGREYLLLSISQVMLRNKFGLDIVWKRIIVTLSGQKSM
jgi:hypothetical protein